MYKLPKLQYRKRRYIVDFRLGEMRDSKTSKPLRFVDIKEDANSPLKKKLRGLRSKTWHNDYTKGIDD
jgi:hypothetical protein